MKKEAKKVEAKKVETKVVENGQKLSKKFLTMIENNSLIVKILEGKKILAILNNSKNLKGRLKKADKDDRLNESISLNGVLVDVLVDRDKSIIDGYCRTFLALKYGKKISVKVTDIEGSKKYSINQSNRSSISELRSSIKEDFDSGDAVKVIAKKYGISSKSVNQALKITDELEERFSDLSFKDLVLLASCTKNVQERLETNGDTSIAEQIEGIKKSLLAEARAKRAGLEKGQKIEVEYNVDLKKITSYFEKTKYEDLKMIAIKNCYDKKEVVVDK